ncbi:MAG: DsbA family protein [Roseiarcus sp.]
MKLEGPRSILVRAIVIAMAAIGVAAYARYAGDPAATSSPQPTASATASLATPPATVPIDRLMTIVPLPDLVQGSPSASITIIEYASTTCSHCAAFHETTWPELKAKYIDSGRAKFILREFPLDPLATASFMLARCAGSDKRDLWVDLFFSQQKTWAFGDRPVEALLAMAERIGMSRTDSENCMKNQDLYAQISQGRERAAVAFNIDSTPTFFVNGRRLRGELALSDFDRVIDPLSK